MNKTNKFITKAKLRHSIQYDYSGVVYQGHREPVIIVCPVHGKFMITPTAHLNGRGCKLCGRAKQGGQNRLTTAAIIKRFIKTHKQSYDYSLVKYTGTKNDVIIICPHHGQFKQTPEAHSSGCGCPKCAGVHKLTTDEFITKARSIHGDKYDYSESVYLGAYSSITIICPTHGKFTQSSAKSHTINGAGCPECGKDQTKFARTLSQIAYYNRANIVHDNAYDYSSSYYRGMKHPVDIRCHAHGVFSQNANDHINGSGCPKCGLIKQKISSSTSIEEFLVNANTIHGDNFTYNINNYVNLRSKIGVICDNHGETLQQASTHLNSKNGCPKCAGVHKLTTDEFITKARSIHGDKYDYDSSIYTDSKSTLIIQCAQHGEFDQRPNNHLCGSGCPKCSHHTSVGENEIRQFIEQLGIVVDQSNRDLISPKELDIYLPEHGVAIEYCGLYWHSERIKHDKFYHLHKFEACKAQGIRLITIFEDEWKTQQTIVKAFLLHLLHKSPKGVGGRKSSIREIEWKTAKPFLNQHHLQGAGKAGKYRIGAFDSANNLLAVMVFGTPSDERGASDVVEMKRFVTDKSSHPGLGSKMTKWAMAHFGFTDIIAFVDRRWFTGDFKTHTGMIPDKTAPIGFYWTDGNVRIHRRATTKKSLIVTHGFDPMLSKRAMMEQLGFYRIWDCGKIKMRLSH